MNRNEPEKQILCLWFPNWPIQWRVVARPELRCQRVVLYQSHPQRGLLVSAASPRAQRDGVRLGMPLSEAESLLDRERDATRPAPASPRTLFAEQDPAEDLEMLQQLALTCDRLSPLVGLEVDGESPQPSAALVLDVTGLDALMGGREQIEARAHSQLTRQGYLVHTALAPTLGAAWGLASYPGSEVTFAELPAAALRLNAATLETLRQLGIEWVGQLLQLPRASLRARLGEDVLRRLDQASGQREERIVPVRPPVEFSAEQFLDYPLADRETIGVVLSRLVHQLCAQMRRQQRGGLQWRVQLLGPPGADSTPVELAVHLFQPTATPRHVMSLIEMQLEQHRELARERKPRRGGAGRGERRKPGGRQPRRETAVAFQEFKVAVAHSVLLVERQRQLYDEDPRLDRQALAHLINRLTGRLGAAHVVAPQSRPGARPEGACTFKPLVGAASGRGVAGGGETPGTTSTGAPTQAPAGAPTQTPAGAADALSPLQRPLQLYPHPRPVSVVSLHGDSLQGDGPPALLIETQRQTRIVRQWGPERLETSWWRGPTVRRDYWRVETDDGRWLWLFRDRRDRQWFIHGAF